MIFSYDFHSPVLYVIKDFINTIFRFVDIFLSFQQTRMSDEKLFPLILMSAFDIIEFGRIFPTLFKKVFEYFIHNTALIKSHNKKVIKYY